MIWVWIIIAVIVVAGLLFWVKSGNKDNKTDLSADEAGLSADTEIPQAPAEAPAEPEVSETPEEPQQEEVSSSDEERKE